MKRVFAALAGVTLFFGVVASSIQPASADPIGRSIANQERRINQGVRSGEITRSEARRLHHKMRAIKWQYAKAKSSGHVSYHERKRINSMLHANSKRIYHKKHNVKRY